jgi:hypothetical protein
MPLAIGHGNTQFMGITFDGLFLPIQGSEIEDSGFRRVALQRLGHAQQNLRMRPPSQWSLNPLDRSDRFEKGAGLADPSCS